MSRTSLTAGTSLQMLILTLRCVDPESSHASREKIFEIVGDASLDVVRVSSQTEERSENGAEAVNQRTPRGLRVDTFALDHD